MGLLRDESGQWRYVALGAIVVVLLLVVAVIGVVVLGIGGLVILADSADGGSGETGPGSDVSDVSVTASDDTPPDAATDIAVRWNARAQSAVDPDPSDFSIYNANEGEKFVVVRMAIENTGDQDIELTPQLFQLEADGVRYDYQSMFGSGNGLHDATLTPGASYSGWVAFSVPSETNSGTLVVNQDAYYQGTVGVTFEEEPGMAINMSA